jgi:hypothetical protein
MSRRVALLVLSALTAVLLAASAKAAPPQVQVMGRYEPGCSIDAIAPGGPFCQALPHRFRYWATPTGVGQRAKGLFTQQPLRDGAPTTTIIGSVRCLNVSGNAAVIGGVFVSPASFAGIPFIVYTVDNGPPGSPTPDLEGLLGAFPPGDPDWVFLPVGFPNACPSATAPIYGYLPLSEGDAIVR